MLAVATHRRPRYLLPLLNSFDELYAGLMLLVERHFLLTYGGGFIENFYGLKRELALRVRGGELPRARGGVPSIVRETLKPSERDVWKNLALMVGLPYLKRKLDESYDIYNAQANVLGPTYARNTLPHDAGVKQRISHCYRWFLKRIYPSVNAAYHFSLLAFNLLYLFGTSKYHSPLLWLIGTRIRRLAEADRHAIAHITQPKGPVLRRPATRPGQTTSIFNPRVLAAGVYPRALSSLRFLLPASIFALKFLEWWHASDFARQLSKKATEGLDLPPPTVSGMSRKADSTAAASSEPVSATETGLADPSSSSPSSPPKKATLADPPLSKTTRLPILTVPPNAASSTSLCPICGSHIVTPTACQTGHVFCYTCIFRWIDGSHPRQTAFMEGAASDEGWGAERGSRQGEWESGEGRCAVTGRRVLGGADALRRVIV